MEAERVDPVAVRIGQKLQAISPISSDCCIFKVPNYLRKVNEKAYEPEVVAIGPFHRGKDHLKPMEERKIRFLQLILQERGENDITKYVVVMRELEERARKCYAEPVSLDSDGFVEMMLLDGCLIIQLIRKSARTTSIDDPIFKMSGFHGILCRDMLLIENQLPLFVLWELFCVIAVPREDRFIDDIIKFFTVVLPGKGCIRKSLRSITENKHLLGLIYDCWHPSAFEMEVKTKTIECSFMHCATELKEAGIRFKKVEGRSIFDIKFENGTMKIPTLEIDDDTEWFLRNVIAYEQFFSGSSLNHVTDYMNFMDCLINSRKDVEILRQRGIVKNWLGDDEVIATMFNRLGDSVTIPAFSLYSEVFNNVNMYCSGRWNKRFANLKHNYFNSPWAFLSFLAAVLFLLLTMVQAVFSVLSYVK
ncbi:Uncharacterized protein TCM_020393 isoform 1 [Theobroma cacao]|uniref:Uncharacterized protein isoform 1 n=1 Tax=Theobroma cacao TaxID=3641 RepID=A0A061ESV3_THECC|nr:Uncharacterized protein TCM_020393 isoform 1 [Theobroma cacao]EOY05384.1 Uncharacterized protein TCM_020393 isoform 1 [Theobroma cacao]